MGNSILMDPSDFAWTDQSFQIDNWNELVIYEMHLGTFPGAAPPIHSTKPSPDLTIL